MNRSYPGSLLHEIRRIVSNSVFIAGQRIANAFLQFILFLLLIHILSSQEMGIFELGRTCLEIGVGIVVPGLAILILREGSRNLNWWLHHSSTIHSFLLFLSILVATVFFGLANLTDQNIVKALVTILFCASIYFQSTCSAFESLLIARDQVKWSMTVNVLCNLSVIGLALLSIWLFPYPLVGVSFLLLVRWIVNHIIYNGRIQILVDAHPPAEIAPTSSMAHLFRDSWLLTLGSIFFILYARIDTLMLEWIGNEESIALYSGAYRLIGLLSMFFLSVYQALTPTISRTMSRSFKKACILVSSMGMLLGLLGLCLTGVIYGWGEFLIAYLYPDTYERTTQGLYVLAWTLPIIFTGNAFGCFLVNESTWGPRYYAAINLFGVIFNITGNWWLIPRYDFIGAAWMTVSTDLVTTVLMILAVFSLSFRIRNDKVKIKASGSIND